VFVLQVSVVVGFLFLIFCERGMVLGCVGGVLSGWVWVV